MFEELGVGSEACSGKITLLTSDYLLPTSDYLLPITNSLPLASIFLQK